MPGAMDRPPRRLPAAVLGLGPSEPASNSAVALGNSVSAAAKADLVVATPDSGRAAAPETSQEATSSAVAVDVAASVPEAGAVAVADVVVSAAAEVAAVGAAEEAVAGAEAAADLV